MLQANHQEILHPAAGVEIPVKSGNPFDPFRGVISNLVKVKVLRGNQLVAEKMFAYILVPPFPVVSSRTIHQDKRHEAAFARLHESQRFKTFVHSAEAPRE